MATVLAAPVAGAKSFRGEVPIFIPLTQATRAIGDTHLLLRWRVWTLMGEPVVLCQAAWVADPQVLRERTGAHDVPDEALARLSLGSVYIEASVETRTIEGGLWEKPSVWLPCDVGAMTKVFLGSLKDFDRLPEREKHLYFSYNAPGSPSWGELFKVGHSYVPAAEAKRILKQHDFRLYDVPGWGKAVVKADLSSWALGMWRSEQRIKQLAERRKRAQEEREERRRRKYGAKETPPASTSDNGASSDFWSAPHAKAQAEATDFWATPDDPLTVEERQEDVRFEAKQREVEAEISTLRRDREREQQRVDEKRKELERRTSDKWCDEIDQQVRKCIYDSCGSKPHAAFALLVCDANDRCCGSCSEYGAPPEGCYSYCQESIAAKKRDARVLSAKREVWQRCADSVRPRCGPAEFRDVPSCKEEMKRFRESMADGFRE